MDTLLDQLSSEQDTTGKLSSNIKELEEKPWSMKAEKSNATQDDAYRNRVQELELQLQNLKEELRASNDGIRVQGKPNYTTVDSLINAVRKENQEIHDEEESQLDTESQITSPATDERPVTSNKKQQRQRIVRTTESQVVQQTQPAQVQAPVEQPTAQDTGNGQVIDASQAQRPSLSQYGYHFFNDMLYNHFHPVLYTHYIFFGNTSSIYHLSCKVHFLKIYCMNRGSCSFRRIHIILG